MTSLHAIPGRSRKLPPLRVGVGGEQRQQGVREVRLLGLTEGEHEDHGRHGGSLRRPGGRGTFRWLRSRIRESIAPCPQTRRRISGRASKDS